jgi:hypothetical protein
VQDVHSGAIPGFTDYINLENRTLNLERILEGIATQTLIDVNDVPRLALVYSFDRFHIAQRRN